MVPWPSKFAAKRTPISRGRWIHLHRSCWLQRAREGFTGQRPEANSGSGSWTKVCRSLPSFSRPNCLASSSRPCSPVTARGCSTSPRTKARPGVRSGAYRRHTSHADNGPVRSQPLPFHPLLPWMGRSLWERIAVVFTKAWMMVRRSARQTWACHLPGEKRLRLGEHRQAALCCAGQS